jgi:hypothetical protein
MVLQGPRPRQIVEVEYYGKVLLEFLHRNDVDYHATQLGQHAVADGENLPFTQVTGRLHLCGDGFTVK